jgi:hypothetical protein
MSILCSMENLWKAALMVIAVLAILALVRVIAH